MSRGSLAFLSSLVTLALGGCCSEAGCSGGLVIHLDRALAADALVTVDLGGGAIDCLGPSEVGDTGCTFGVDPSGEPFIEVRLDPGEPPARVVVSVSEGGAPASEHEVEVVADEETFSPNGERCGPTCYGARAELTLPGAGG